MKSSKIRYWNLLPALLLFGGVAYMYAAVVPYQLGLREQLTLFLTGEGSLGTYSSRPAMAAEFVGEFLSMFYYSKTWAALISITLLLILWRSLTCSMKRLGAAAHFRELLALVPVAMEAAFLVYADYPLSATVGFILSVCCFNLMTRLNNFKVISLSALLFSPLLYLLSGSHTIIFLLLSAVYCFRNGCRVIATITHLTGVGAICLTGIMKGLPVTLGLLYPMLPTNSVPSLALLLTLPLSVLLISLTARCIKRTTAVETAALTLLLAAAAYSWTKSVDKRKEFEVEIGTRAYRSDWRGVKLLALSHGHTRYGIYFRNLSFAREGKLATELLNYPQALWEGLGMDIYQGVRYLDIWYYIDQLLLTGDLSHATDCALLGQTVMSRSRSSRMIRELIRISLVAGDCTVAEKYIGMLEHTPNHKEWCRQMRLCAERDSLPQELQRFREATATHDILYEQNNKIQAMRAIAATNINNVVGVDYILCGYLLGKNTGSFRQMYDSFYLNRLDRVTAVPRVYCEALLSTARNMDDYNHVVERYGIPREIAEGYLDFIDAQDRSQGNINAIKRFTGSYWYYLVTTPLN